MYKFYKFILNQMCSGITRGRVLHGELYAQRFPKLIHLHLFTDYVSSIVGANTVACS